MVNENDLNWIDGLLLPSSFFTQRWELCWSIWSFNDMWASRFHWTDPGFRSMIPFHCRERSSVLYNPKNSNWNSVFAPRFSAISLQVPGFDLTLIVARSSFYWAPSKHPFSFPYRFSEPLFSLFSSPFSSDRHPLTNPTSLSMHSSFFWSRESAVVYTNRSKSWIPSGMQQSSKASTSFRVW